MNTMVLAELSMLVLFITTLLLVIASKKATGRDKLIWFLMSFMFPFVGYLIFYFYRITSRHLDK